MSDINSLLYKDFFNDTDVLHFIINSDYAIIQSNKIATKLFNIKSELPFDIRKLQAIKKPTRFFETISDVFENKEKVFECYLIQDKNTVPYKVYAKRIEVEGLFYIICTAHTIIDKKELEDQILKAVIETEEKERSRFAKDLHDGLGPLLSTIKLYVHELKSTDSSEEEKQEYIKYIIELLDEAVTNTREISNNLTPQIISTYGLVKSIDSFKNKVNATQKLKINFFNQDVPEDLSKTIKLTLFRIIIELINNTINHASANCIYIGLYVKNNKLHLDYKDDGICFNLNDALTKGTSGIGLINIINRIKSMSGTFSFNEKLTKGVEMKFSIDINK